MFASLRRPGSAAQIPNFSSFSLPSRPIVSVGTFIAPIENHECPPRKAFVYWLRTKKRVSVDSVPVSDVFSFRYFPIGAALLAPVLFCIGKWVSYCGTVNLLFNTVLFVYVGGPILVYIVWFLIVICTYIYFTCFCEFLFINLDCFPYYARNCQ